MILGCHGPGLCTHFLNHKTKQIGGEGPGTEGWAGMAKAWPVTPCVIWDSFFITVLPPIFEMKTLMLFV